MRKEENGKDRHQGEDENANNVENHDENDDETDEYDNENYEYDAADDDEYDKEDGEYGKDDEIHTTGEKYELFWLLKSSPLPALLVSHMIILIIIQPELMGPFRTFVI